MSELRKLRHLKQENAKLKQIVAGISLDRQMVQDRLEKSFEAQAAGAPRSSVATMLPGLSSSQLHGRDDAPLGL